MWCCFCFQLWHIKMLPLDHKATLKSENHVFSPIISKCYSHLSKIRKLFNKIVHGVTRIMRRTCLHLPVETCYYDARKGDHRTQEGKGGFVGRNVKKGEVGRSVSTPDILQREVVHAIHIATPAMQNVYLYYYYYYYYIYIYIYIIIIITLL